MIAGYGTRGGIGQTAGVRREGGGQSSVGRAQYRDRINSLGWTKAFTMSNRHEHSQYE